MLRNYFKVALRSLLKHKGYSLINIIGLSLGLMAGTLILMYVADELSFDEFHVQKDRLYRVNTSFSANGQGDGGIETNGWPVGKILEKEFPEVESVLYTRSAGYLLVSHEGKLIRQKNHYATPEFFKMFSFPLIKGNPVTALDEPYSVVISEDMEKKYFPDGDALNKTLVFLDTLNFKVTGVMKNIPTNSHIQAEIITSFATYERLESFSYSDGWGQINMRNYVLLKEGVNVQAFADKAKNIYMERVGDMMKQWGVQAYLSFEPFSKIYLHTKSGNGMGPTGSIDRIYLLSAIAFFVILLACINFINLTTARSVHRAKEVGLRKVVGSSRGSLIIQYLSESASITSIGLLVALAVLGIMLPAFNELLEKNYTIAWLLQPHMVIGIMILFIMITILSGYYPAWILSAMKPSEVLKGKMQTSTSGMRLRRGLVIFQFVISTGLVTGTIIVLQQLDYMQQQNLGFQKDQILTLSMSRVTSTNPNAFETFKEELKTLAGIQDISFANAVPGSPGWRGQVAYPEGGAGEQSVSVEYVAVDDRYIDVLGLELIAGRKFDPDRSAELKEGLILNEAAVKTFGWSSPEEAIGKRIASPSGTPAGIVIGVVKDYHQEGLQQKIGPITMDYAPEYAYLYAIQYKAADTQQLIGQISEIWKRHFPSFDLNYSFLDESFERQYQSEKKVAKVFALFATITIIIASIGLLGLVSFMITVRTKEIGVRKLLGASVWSIIQLVNKEFMILVVISVFVSAPAIWYYGQQWLQKFAYRMEINPMIFLITLSIALLLTLAMVSIQSIRAALSNPVDSLRNE